MHIVRDKVAKLLGKGYVKKCESAPKFVNPLTIAKKLDHTSRDLKYRYLIILICVGSHSTKFFYKFGPREGGGGGCSTNKHS